MAKIMSMKIENFSGRGFSNRVIVDYMDNQNEGLRLDEKKELRGQATDVVNAWANVYKLEIGDLVRQVRFGSNTFREDKIDGKVNPETDLDFWMKYGVQYWEKVNGVVLGKKGSSLYQEQIGISSDLAGEAAEKMKKGEIFERLSKPEKVSMLMVTKAKLEAVKEMMLSVYPVLEDDYLKKNKIIDGALTELLVDEKSVRDVAGNIDLKRIIPAGKLVLPSILAIGSLLVSACGVSGVSAEAKSTPTSEGAQKTAIAEMVEDYQAKTATAEASVTKTAVPLTSTAEPSVTVEVTPTAESTAIPVESPTPIVEVVDYGKCTVENFEQCPIPEEDLFNGKYEAFLETLSAPFDPSKFKNPLPKHAVSSDLGIYYNPATAPHFPNPEEAPFRRNVTAGEVVLKDGRKYIVLPIEFPDFNDPTNKDKNVWVIAVKNLFSVAKKSYGRPLTDEKISQMVYGWKTMNITPIQISYINPNSGMPDSLYERTFKEHPDMDQRLEKFFYGDNTALKGMVVLTEIFSDYPGYK